MNFKGLVSVVIPTYNRGGLIGRAINSVLSQSYSDIEVIIVDDGSNDNTQEVVAGIYDKRIKYIHLEENLGANTARNKGIEISKGEYLAFNDSDDVWLPDKLKIQLEFMEKNKVDISFHPYERHLQNGKVTGVATEYKEHVFDKKELLKILSKRNIAGTPTLLMKKYVIKNIGLFDSLMIGLQDYEFVIRAAKKYKVGICGTILLQAYVQNISISTRPMKIFIAKLQLACRHTDIFDADNAFVHLPCDKDGIHDYNSCVEGIKKCIELLDYYCGYDKNLYSYYKAENRYDRIKNVLAHTADILKQWHKEENEILKENFYEEIYIYGAGVIGNRAYHGLKNRGIKIKGFVITNKENIPHTRNKILPIYCLDEIEKDSFLIIASDLYKNEMIENLKDRGMSNYYFWKGHIFIDGYKTAINKV